MIGKVFGAIQSSITKEILLEHSSMYAILSITSRKPLEEIIQIFLSEVPKVKI